MSHSPEAHEIDIAFLNEFTNKEECHLESCNITNIQPPFDITPKDFLKYAEYDLNNEYTHHLINSLSNIKRAIDCQLDSLLYGFGLFEKSKIQKWNFPTKIDYLNRLEVISPRILLKINQKRNLLEHEYIRPNKSDVEDALDIAILFIVYTDKYLLNAIVSCEPYNFIEEYSLEVNLDYEKNMITISKRRDKETLKEINADSEDYIKYLKWFISLYELS